MITKEAYVSDSSPIILLSKINRIMLLKELFKEIFIARAVYAEVIEKGKKDEYNDAFIAEKCIGDFISVKDVLKSEELSRLKSGLGAGEAESIMLSKQIKANLIIDDWKSRKIAESLGLKCKGTLGVLFEALRREKLSLSEYEKVIKDLASNAWISGDMIAESMQAGYKLRGGKK